MSATFFVEENYRHIELWEAKYASSTRCETDQLDYIHDLVHRLDVMERIEAILPDEMGKPPCQ